jgi:DNA-binding response OmpR family regulator
MPKILFIEDEPGLQTTLGAALRREGFDVILALNGDDGLRLAQSEMPDLILLDLILPKRSGFDVLEQLKAEGAQTRAIPVIVLTNLEGLGDVDRALSLGATTYLVKANYEVNDVIAKIRQVLQSKEEKPRA